MLALNRLGRSHLNFQDGLDFFQSEYRLTIHSVFGPISFAQNLKASIAPVLISLEYSIRCNLRYNPESSRQVRESKFSSITALR